MKGVWKIELYRKGVLIQSEELENLITTNGKNDLLDVYFRSGSATATWYVGLIDESGFGAIAAGDTLSSKDWSEFTGYTESNRQQWNPDPASGGSMSNGTAEQVNINIASGGIKGMFLVSDNTKGGTSGTLVSVVEKDSALSVTNGDTVNITYTVEP